MLGFLISPQINEGTLVEAAQRKPSPQVPSKKAAVPREVCKWQDHHCWMCKLRSLWLCQALVPKGEKGRSKQHLSCLGPLQLSFHFLPVENSAKPIKLVEAVSRPEGESSFLEGDPIGEGRLKFTAPLED